MKKLFLMFVVAGLTLTAAAQKTEKQVATLQHGNQTTVFYGIDAFVSAYNAAADTLDVITLSGGEFNVPIQISKSVAIYGAGCENDTITGTQRTEFNNILSSVSANGVHIEGVYVSEIYIYGIDEKPIHNLSIVKCKVNVISFATDCYDCVIRQSIIMQRLQRTQDSFYNRTKYAHNLLISNCYIYDTADEITWGNYALDFSNTSIILIDHCIIKSKIQDVYNNALFRYTNNIIYLSSLPTSADCSNNIFIIGGDSSVEADEEGNWYHMNGQDVWADENENGIYAENKTFDLKNTTRYIGNDFTQIGLHGGVYAWNKTPVIPRITECTIDTENVNSGTLKVSIKAEAQTKE